MSAGKLLTAMFAAMVCAQSVHAQTAPQRSYIVCTIREAAGPPERKQSFVIDDGLRSLDGVSRGAISTFTPEKIVWRDESFETTLDRVAGFVTINLLASGDLYGSGSCVRADGPKF